MTFDPFDPNINRFVETPCGERVHLAGLSDLLSSIGRVPLIVARRAVELQGQDTPMGAEQLEAHITDELGGIPSHPAIELGSNVVSIFRNQ